MMPGNTTINATATPVGTDMKLNMETYDEMHVSIKSFTGGEGHVISLSLDNTNSVEAQFYVRLGGLLGSSYNGDYSITFDD